VMNLRTVLFPHPSYGFCSNLSDLGPPKSPSQAQAENSAHYSRAVICHGKLRWEIPPFTVAVSKA
jgi:hypothetical protein